MALDLDLLLGIGKMPEGFSAVLSQDVDTAGPLGTYSFKLEEDYWFFLEAVLAKWTAPTVLSVPRLEIFREEGARAYIPTPVDFRLVTSPGEAPLARATLGRVVGLGMYFGPGAALQMRLTGYVAGNPAEIKVAAFGRYVLRPGA